MTDARTDAHAPGGDPAPVVLRAVRWEQRRGQVMASLVQDVPVVVTLLYAGLTGLAARGGGADLILAAAEVAVSAWLVTAAIREVRHVFAPAETHGAGHDPAPAGRVDRPLLAGAALALVEAWHHWHASGHVKRPTLLLGAVYAVLALGGRAAIARRMRGRGPRLAVSREGILYRATRRHRFHAAWSDVASLGHAPGALHLTLRDGRTWALHAHEHEGGDVLLAAARDAVAAHAPPRLAAGARPPR